MSFGPVAPITIFDLKSPFDVFTVTPPLNSKSLTLVCVIISAPTSPAASSTALSNTSRVIFQGVPSGNSKSILYFIEGEYKLTSFEGHSIIGLIYGSNSGSSSNNLAVSNPPHALSLGNFDLSISKTFIPALAA